MDYNYNDYELIYLVREEHEEALNLIIKKYDPIIKNMASYYIGCYKNIKLEYEDLVQEGRLALVICINRYNYLKDILFFTFAVTCIKRKLINVIRNSLNNKQLVLNYSLSLDDDNVKEQGYFTFDFITNDEINKIVTDFKYLLNPEDSWIFELKINGFSFKEISQLLDISKKAVSNRVYKIQKTFKKFMLKNEEIIV